jgi:hypothetical protein
MGRIRREDYTLVTNNGTDFTALYAGEELHADFAGATVTCREYTYPLL